MVKDKLYDNEKRIAEVKDQLDDVNYAFDVVSDSVELVTSVVDDLIIDKLNELELELEELLEERGSISNRQMMKESFTIGDGCELLDSMVGGEFLVFQGEDDDLAMFTFDEGVQEAVLWRDGVVADSIHATCDAEGVYEFVNVGYHPIITSSITELRKALLG